jgi:outer membrane protein assembly factor BamB
LFIGQTNTVHGGLTQGRIRAFDASTGDSLWTYQTDNDGFYTRTYVQDGVVYGGTKGNSPNSEVVALDATTGQVIWQYVAENTLEYTENFLVTDNYVFAKGSGYIFALDKSTGEKKWGFRWTSSSSVEIAHLEGYVYVTNMGKIFVLEEYTGELVHTEPVPSGERYFWHLTAGADKLFAQTDATITAYEPWHLQEK